MAKEHRNKGLVVIGVSDEEFDLIDKYVADKGIEFPIARLASGEFEEAIGVKGFPSSAILSPKGELVWTGHPGEADSVLGGHMKGSRRTPLLPKELASVEKLLDGDDYAAAYAELKKLLDAAPAEQVRSAAEALVSYIDGRANRLWTKGSAALEERDYYTASLALSELAVGYKGIGSAAEAEAKVAEFKKDAAIQKEIKAGEQFAAAAVLVEEHEYDKAYKAYRSVAAKHKGTAAAERALERADEIKADGLIGFDKNCAECRTGRKACARHGK